MSRSVWILLLLLILWIILGIYFWKFNPFQKSDSGNNAPCVVSWELKDNTKSIAKSDATFNFKKSTAEMAKVDAGLTEAVNAISKYLKENKDKSMTVIGYYDKDESYASNLYDLAVARANAVKSMLTKKGVAANQLHVFPMRYDDKRDNSDCIDGNMLNRGASFQMGIKK